MASNNLESEIRTLREKLKNYKVGSIEGLHSFSDALEGEMEGLQIRLAVFGMTGAGKSSLVNTIWKTLYGRENAPAIEQSSGAEGTQLLEDFHSQSGTEDDRGGFVFHDTRGFNFDFNRAEENEFFRILYGVVSAGQLIERGDWAEKMAEDAGQAAHRLEKPPVADQVHVALWVIKANDIRFVNGQYLDKFNFVRQKLNAEGVTIITVLTHDDKLDSEERNEAKKNAMEVTGSKKAQTFVFANWLGEQEEYDVRYQREVLKMLHTALGCGERSVRSRQIQRKLSKQ